MLKIDNVEDLAGKDVAGRLTQGRVISMPFHGIFDREGKLLIDSEGPAGNIGSASGYEGKKHLREMLDQTRQQLSAAEVEKLLSDIKE